MFILCSFRPLYPECVNRWIEYVRSCEIEILGEFVHGYGITRIQRNTLNCSCCTAFQTNYLISSKASVDREAYRAWLFHALQPSSCMSFKITTIRKFNTKYIDKLKKQIRALFANVRISLALSYIYSHALQSANCSRLPSVITERQTRICRCISSISLAHNLEISNKC